MNADRAKYANISLVECQHEKGATAFAIPSFSRRPEVLNRQKAYFQSTKEKGGVVRRVEKWHHLFCRMYSSGQFPKPGTLLIHGQSQSSIWIYSTVLNVMLCT